ncbi:hypothetical protein AOLI_G00151010 [Acnodon oligacanthus]
MAITVNSGTFFQPGFGDNVSRLSNIPFWDGHRTDELKKTYETTVQRDFKSVGHLTKRAAVPRPVLAQVEHKDLQHIKEFQTEAGRAFTPYHVEPINRIPAWTRLVTKLKMHSDKQYLNFHTTQSESFQHLAQMPFVRCKPSRLVMAALANWQEDKPPNTTQRASYVPHKISPIVRPVMKPLGGTPAITGDRRDSCFSSSYNDNFQYRWCSPPQSTEKQWHSSLPMGDKRKIAEKETTHSASFIHTGVHSPVLLKQRLRVNLGDNRDQKWSTTTSDTFTEIKPDWVHVKPTNRTLSSIPQGDTDERRNQERMATTNHFFFSSEKNYKQFPVHVDGASIRTKSNVRFGEHSLGGTLYSTTNQENYLPKPLAPAQPQHYPPGRVLADQEPGPAFSTVQSDYTPPNCTRHDLSPEKLLQIKASHIRPPRSEHCFTTTHKEAFEPKPFSKASLDNCPRQHISHIAL